MNGEFKAVIFDLDGTLLYTLEDLADSVNYVLKDEGLPVHEIDEYRFMVGNGLENLLVRALPKGMRIPAHVRPILAKFLEHYRSNLWVKTRPYDGIQEMLAELARLGIRLAVLSNKNHPNTLRIVEHFFPGVFEVVLGMRPDVPAKPNPAGALEIIESFGLKPEEIAYLGDSNVDMETALGAGLYPMGAAWGYRPREELTAAGAGVIIDSPDQLPAVILSSPAPLDERNEDGGSRGLLRPGSLAELDLGRLVTPPPKWAADRPDIAEMLVSRPGRARLALTGGVASGKTAVAEMLIKKGAGHIDFDLLARRAVEPGTPELEKVVRLFGPEAVLADGGLNRRETGRRAFRDPELKKGLEDIIHPRTWELMAEELAALDGCPVVVISVPLLFEAGLETFFSPIVLAFAVPEIQMERLMARNPELRPEDAGDIIASQWPAPPKVMGSTFIINNNGTLAETAGQVEAIWPKIAV